MSYVIKNIETRNITATTGDLTLTSTAGSVLINDAVNGVSIDTGINTITVNTADVVIVAPLPQDIVGALNALQASSAPQNLDSVLTTGNLTGANTIVIGTGSGGILSTIGTNITIDAGIDDLLLSGDNITTTATGNVLNSITGTSTTNAAGITLTSSAALAASGTTAAITASTGDLTLTSTLGSVLINDAVNGVSIDTGTNTITVNTADVVIVAPLPQDIVGALNALQASSAPQNLDSVLTTGNLTGANTIVIGTGSGGILSTIGTNITIDAGVDDLLLSGDNTTINTVGLTTTATGNVLNSITGTSTTNAAGITLTSSAALAASGTATTITASTGDLTLTSTAGSVLINDAVNGVSVDTGTNIITVNTADVVINAPLPQDIVGALNTLQSSISSTQQRISYQLTTIRLLAPNNFPPHKPIYWVWYENRYGAAGMNYTNPILVFYNADFPTSVHVVNNTGVPSDMLAITSFGVGFHAVALAPVPTADASIYVEVRATTPGMRGTIFGMSLEWITNNPP